MVTLWIDNRAITAAAGRSLLRVCLENGIFIPNLCDFKGKAAPSASCRLCFVEVEGMNGPVPACTVRTLAGMVVRTDTPAVRRLQRSALRLLLSAHRVDCRPCPANKNCELQRLARFLKIPLKYKGLQPCLKDRDVDTTHPLLKLHSNRCVLCGKCILVCQSLHDHALLTFTHRGVNTRIGIHEESDLSGFPCVSQCRACMEICPVSAITIR